MSDSGQRLRFRGLQEEVKYRRAVACLRKLRADEIGSKGQVGEYERAFWREVSQAGQGVLMPYVSAVAPMLDPIRRLKHQQQLLSKAKIRHSGILQQCRDQGVVVERCGLIREKIAESLTLSVRLRSSRLQSRSDEESCAVAAFQSSYESGVRLRISCTLPGGVPAHVSLCASQKGAIAAMVESPSAAVVGRLQSQRFAIEAALRSRGFSIESIKVQRRNDAESQAIHTAKRGSRALLREAHEDDIA